MNQTPRAIHWSPGEGAVGPYCKNTSFIAPPYEEEQLVMVHTVPGGSTFGTGNFSGKLVLRRHFEQSEKSPSVLLNGLVDPLAE